MNLCCISLDFDKPLCSLKSFLISHRHHYDPLFLNNASFPIILKKELIFFLVSKHFYCYYYTL